MGHAMARRWVRTVVENDDDDDDDKIDFDVRRPTPPFPPPPPTTGDGVLSDVRFVGGIYIYNVACLLVCLFLSIACALYAEMYIIEMKMIQKTHDP